MLVFRTQPVLYAFWRAASLTTWVFAPRKANEWIAEKVNWFIELDLFKILLFEPGLNWSFFYHVLILWQVWSEPLACRSWWMHSEQIHLSQHVCNIESIWKNAEHLLHSHSCCKHCTSYRVWSSTEWLWACSIKISSNRYKPMI